MCALERERINAVKHGKKMAQNCQYFSGIIVVGGVQSVDVQIDIGEQQILLENLQKAEN
jgi:hypothetical protein